MTLLIGIVVVLGLFCLIMNRIEKYELPQKTKTIIEDSRNTLYALRTGKVVCNCSKTKADHEKKIEIIVISKVSERIINDKFSEQRDYKIQDHLVVRCKDCKNIIRENNIWCYPHLAKYFNKPVIIE